MGHNSTYPRCCSLEPLLRSEKSNSLGFLGPAACITGQPIWLTQFRESSRILCGFSENEQSQMCTAILQILASVEWQKEDDDDFLT